ncbi:MAG: putative glycolate oxidase subunit GlcD, partial [Proteobacteria bacterium]|nr:putative glycolate oxidase subunit GlcD [Pseudomonadota bacterium]
MSKESLIEELVALVGEANVLTAAAEMAPHLIDWRRRYRGAARCVVRPANTAEVCAVVRACGEAGVPIVPQGGNTSHCGASIPDGSGEAIVLSLSRMNR